MLKLPIAVGAGVGGDLLAVDAEGEMHLVEKASAERKREQKKRWFKNGQRWRTGCEGRISVLKRRHGLRRCI